MFPTTLITSTIHRVALARSERVRALGRALSVSVVRR
jgi:hypothetical protein